MTKFLAHTPNGFDLPRRVARIGELAYNLWWTWNPDATRLFARLDYDLWEALAHNPILMLRQVGRSALNAAAQNKDYLAMYDRVFSDFDLYLSEKKTWADSAHPELAGRPVAYFSME
jgi:starch phosphorylase